jgi:methylenetetrahydrofolate reductase (NADPH)
MRVRALILALALSPVPAAAQHAFPETPRGEIGLRYWLSSGESKLSQNAQHRAPSLGNPSAVMTYENLDANALELVGQIAAMNRGAYLEDLEEATPTDFSIGVACYPEKHEEAPNLERDIAFLVEKQRAGAEYAVTQLFYDNEAYFAFVKAARNQGVTIPIVPGLKLLTRRSHVTSIPRAFNVSVPEALVAEVAAAPDERLPDVGIEWARRQTLQLFERGAPSAHFYVMQDTGPLVRLLEQLKPEL